MANIPVSVSINAKGDIDCPDTLGASIGDTIAWSVTTAAGGTITNITPGRPSPFTANPAISNGQWSATIAGAGSYTITDSQGKQRSPKITLVLPETVKY
ncbi:MAG: hypothetical protein ACHQFX_15350 [Chitinophagales bacterium]